MIACVRLSHSVANTRRCSSTSSTSLTPRARCRSPSAEERDVLRARILRFLHATLLPHAKAEEEILYPQWAKLVGFADAAVPMVHDHEAIVARIERLEAANIDDVDTLQELLYGLYALVSVHFRKEEDLQLPAFDAAPEIAEQVIARMAAAAGDAHTH